jgi:hypothetical protein
MRMSIVGKEGESYWYEVVNEEPHGRNIVKRLVKSDPHNQENIQRLIIKTGNNQAQEMPLDFVLLGRKMAGHMFEQRSGIPINPEISLTNELIGKGKTVVPAGEINITKNQIVDNKGKVYARYKFSPEIHPLGVVATDTEISSMVLMDYGTDAKSVITEDPVKMTRASGNAGRTTTWRPPRIHRTARRNEQAVSGKVEVIKYRITILNFHTRFLTFLLRP